MAFRRDVIRDVGLFDERFRWYRTADIECSFRIKEAGLRALRVDVPVSKHEYRMYHSTPPAGATRLSKRNSCASSWNGSRSVRPHSWKARRLPVLGEAQLDDDVRLPDGELAATLPLRRSERPRVERPHRPSCSPRTRSALTPLDAPERGERLLELAGNLKVAGERRRITDLLAPQLASLPAGAARVRAYLLLASGVVEDNDDIRGYLERALVESGRRSRIALAGARAYLRERVRGAVERIHEAERWALEAAEAAPRAGADAERVALYALGWARSLQGRAIDDVCRQFVAASEAAHYIAESPERVAGQRLVWRGELQDAWASLTRLLALADERGEPSSLRIAAAARLRARAALGRLGRGRTPARRVGCLRRGRAPALADVRALPGAARRRTGEGIADETERWAADALTRAESTGVRWDRLEALRARGLVALLAHEPARAAEACAPSGSTPFAQAWRNRAPSRSHPSSSRRWSSSANWTRRRP